MKTFFQKLRKLLENSKEDYLTEILAYSLQNDLLFRKRFLGLLPSGYQEKNNFRIETQRVYKTEKRRSDIEINLGHAYIIIECKLGATEGNDQLDSYAEILSGKGFEDKLLVFLTSNRETKEKDYIKFGVGFLQLRWHDIGHCISDACDTITKEFKYYLQAEKIIMDKISYGDIVAFQAFSQTRKKFNNILNDVSRLYVEKGLHKYNTYQPTMRSNEYALVFSYGKHINITLGFGNWWGEHPCLFTRVWISHKKDAKGNTVKSIHQKLEQAGWYLVTNQKDGFSVEYKEQLLDYLSYKENQREKIIAFFSKCIFELADLKHEYPVVFDKSERPAEPAMTIV